MWFEWEWECGIGWPGSDLCVSGGGCGAFVCLIFYIMIVKYGLPMLLPMQCYCLCDVNNKKYVIILCENKR